ncbi:MAG: hypothetical protein ACI9XP_001457 [Lentimonas sp.]|jgi:hypothetical protein
MFNKPFKVFFIAFFALVLFFFLFPINLFNGEIIYQNGIQEMAVQAPLSLSYFIGMGYEEADMVGIKDFYLLPAGYALASTFLLGIPGLLAFRLFIKSKSDSHKK